MPVHDRLTEVAGVPPPVGYTHAVTVSGRLAFLSGQVALDGDGNLVGPDDVAAQTAQALGNLHRIMRTLGADWPDVVRFGWYILDTAHLPAIRAERDRFLRPALGDRPNPASSLVQVAGLLRPDLLIEVDAVVAVPG